MKQRRHTPNLPRSLALALALLALPAWTAATAQSAQSAQSGAPATSEAYGYFRTVEGASLLSTREPEETRDLEINLPILAGDAVQVGAGSRVEAVLADGSVARFEAGSEVIFDQLAFSPDSPGVSSSRLVLLAGELQIRVPDETADRAPLEIESASGRIYLIRGGAYWIGVAGTDGTRLIVREGAAEVLTEEGSRLVQSGEELEISNRYGVETRVARAGYERGIETWARDLERQAYVADHGPVEQPLRYQAAPLARSGSWVRVDGRVAWRPRVRYGWRPFVDGRWTYTPSGLTWVASTSWGYVTSHYGSWDYLPSFGWCWFPGAVYSPAWVYWYWGPTHAAWVPYGYYARHYGPRYGWRYAGYGRGGFGLRFGVYGYASGGWSVFADWTFCPLTYFGRRGGRHYYRSGHELARARRSLAVPRGIITTDTRGIDRAVWTRPYEARRRLADIHRGSRAGARLGEAGDLPDVTSFVARRRELPADLQAVVKPLAEAERRPALDRIDRAGRAADGRVDRVEGRVGDRAGGVATREALPRKPAGVLGSTGARGDREVVSQSRTLVRPGERSNSAVTGRDTSALGDRAADARRRFETKPQAREGRPTEFERAPTTVYRAPAATGGRSTGGERPSVVDRAPAGSVGGERAAIPGRAPAGASRGERPTSGFDRAPTSVYRRPSADAGRSVIGSPGSSSAGGSSRASGSAIDRRLPSSSPPAARAPVTERKPLVDERGRAGTRVYPSPGRDSAAERGSAARPPAVGGPLVRDSARPPATRAPSAPPARRVVDSVRSWVGANRAGSSSGSVGTRSEPSPPPASGSQARPAPSRAPSSRASSPPPRPSSRVESPPARSSGSRVQSSSRSASGSRSSASSRSTARRKDDGR